MAYEEDSTSSTGENSPEQSSELARFAEQLQRSTAEAVEKFHQKDDADVRDESHHHTLGIGPTQAAKGSHNHMGGNGLPILTGQTITGAKGGNTALASVIALLAAMGATDATT